MRHLAPVLILVFLIAGCAETRMEAPVSAAPKRDRASVGYKVGIPYQIKGVWYYPKEDFSYSEVGLASWYGRAFHGKTTANGETYDMNDMTAAHKTLPMPSVVRVTNLENGRSIKLRVNDRGPFIDGRIIDVSRRASQMLGFQRNGVARVKVDVVSDESRILAGLPAGGEQAYAARAVGYTAARAGSGAQADATASATTARLNAAVQANLARSTASSAARREPAAVPVATPSPVARPVPARTAFAPPGPINLTEAAAGPPGYEPFARDGMAEHELQPWVQAGAFSYAANAELVRSQLRDLGPVMISTVERDGAALFRVRVGPATNDDEAGRLLAAVMEAGFPSSRIVYD